MKNLIYGLMCLLAISGTVGCGSSETQSDTTTAIDAQHAGGQEAVVDDVSQKDIVKIAVGSADHTTLVAALKQAEYVDDISNAGPFTVFAPTNEAFAKVPKETLDDLMKDENRLALQNILEYHVAVGVYRQDYLNDGQTVGMANGQNVTIHLNGDKLMVNEVNVVATIPASNGLIYVVDGVLLPPAK
ncbi:MAG TPA: fasciclin domain-containing protein [Chitinophagales bacterium]|nr:fasciclin domain-containing protein [Chitinophagales bacterium]